MERYKYNSYGVKRLSDGAGIPSDPNNMDWVAYLAWVEAGGITEPEFTPEEIKAEQLKQAILALTNKLSQGNAQVRAIQGRITTLEWLINDQDPDDEDYEEPTPEDEAELASLKPRLTKWNSYNNKLSKVSAQATWPANPVWPVMPDLYTIEMSAVAPESI